MQLNIKILVLRIGLKSLTGQSWHKFVAPANKYIYILNYIFFMGDKVRSASIVYCIII